MSKGIGITELTTLLTARPRLVGAIREQEKAGFLSTTELEALLAGSVGTVDITDGALSADAAGRAKMADGFFDNTAIAKLADGIFAADAASRAKFANDLWNNDAIAKFAEGLFAADAASRAKFVNAIWENAKLATPARRVILAVPIVLANITAADIVTDILPGFAGTIDKIFFVTGTIGGSAGAPAWDLHLEIVAAAVTGGVVTLNLGATDTLGKVTEGTGITALNVFTDANVLSLVAAGAGAFNAGAGVMVLVCSVAGQ